MIAGNTGSHLRSFQSTFRKQPELLITRVWASHSPPVSLISCPTSNFNQPRALVFPVSDLNMLLDLLTSQDRSPSVKSPFSSKSPPRGACSNLIAPLLFPPSSVSSFLEPWLYRRLSASFQVVFSENSPTCRCIFDVFRGEDEFCILLPCHLDWALNSL